MTTQDTQESSATGPDDDQGPLMQVIIMNSDNADLTDKKIKELFDSYSYAMIKACITETQKEKALALSKILPDYSRSSAHFALSNYFIIKGLVTLIAGARRNLAG